MKPLPVTRAGPPPESVAVVRRLLGRLDPIGEAFGLAALDDDTLVPIATALTHAADLAGRWLTDRGDRPPASTKPPVPEPTASPPEPLVWVELFGGGT